MTDRSDPTGDLSHHVEDSSPRSIVAISRCKVRIVRSSKMESTEAPSPGGGTRHGAIALRQAEADEASGEAGRVLRARDDAPSAAAVVALPAVVSLKERADLVRERTNAATRPILESFARRRAIPLERLQAAIDGSIPLTHPEVVRRLGGALHSEAMRNQIVSHADPTLVPLNVRAGVAKMMAQDLADPSPAAAQTAFPDRNKPLAPLGRHLQTWRPEDAAVWLERFPPSDDLLHPLDVWDSATAAIWLNDREANLSGPPCEGTLDGTVVAFESRDPWLPSLEVLHTLHEIELEELTYRVFVERLRREVMPFYLSERRVYVQRAIELVTFGYQTLREARQSVRIHDLRRIEHFRQVFGENQEWIYDLCCRIIAAYAWPAGFAEPELWSDFPDLDDAPQ